MAVGGNPWSMLTRREGFGLACRAVALGSARGMGDMEAPRACAERGKYHGPCIGGMWDVARRRWWRGQGRAGQGHGMAWHGHGRKDRLGPSTTYYGPR